MPDEPVALITGSGKKRIGNIIARDLARAGYRVALHFRTSREEAEAAVADLRAQGSPAQAFAGDLRNEGEMRQLVEQVLAFGGRLDVLVCAAATWLECPLEKTSASEFQAEWESNTLGTFLCCKYAGLEMVKQPQGGNLILIGDWAISRPYLHHVAYLASKGALPTLTRTLAVEFAARNPRVRVNCILPGPVMLPDSLSPQEKQAIIEATLLKREGRPENIAQAIRFFLENDFVTGVCLPVDGGRSIYAGESLTP